MDGETESVTQLADIQPQIDTPIRVLIPNTTNAPARISKSSRDEYIRTNAFSPKALASALSNTLQAIGPSSRISSLPTLKSSTSSDAEAKIKTSIHDYTTLAFSSHRAGKRDIEASAYISLGVIYDNLGNYHMGIENYQHYLSITKELGDIHAQSVACNCLGVNYMLLARSPSDEGFLNGFQRTEENISYLRQALDYHKQYVHTGDKGGKFVANINIGLCHGALGEFTAAAKHYQEALRVAIQMQTLYGQSIAVGNLGMIVMNKKDYGTARTCFEQHLQLVQSVHDPEGEVNAWKLLARISSLQESHVEAIELLEHARRVALKNGYFNEVRRILCLMGIAKGSASFSTQTERILSDIDQESKEC